jgi:glycosyltransferase involved in cell wall biosynthesis
MATLTILLPTYNGAAYLDEQLRSIQAQEFADWRLLLADDGSTDATPALLRAFAAAEPRARVLPTQGNRGQRERLGELGAAADTDLIAVADQDDVWAPDKLRLLVDALGDRDLSYGSSRLIDGEGRDLGRDLADALPRPFREGDRLSFLFRPLASAHATVARRALLNPLSLGRALPFDWLMTVEAAFGRGVAFVPEARTFHRLHGANQSNASFVGRPPPPRVVSRSALVTLPRSLEDARLRFMGMLEHLRFAATVDDDARARAAAAREKCREGWYFWWRDGWASARRLRAELEPILRPLAGSESDWDYAAAHLDTLCLPAWSPRRVVARARRLRLDAARD